MKLLLSILLFVSVSAKAQTPVYVKTAKPVLWQTTGANEVTIALDPATITTISNSDAAIKDLEAKVATLTTQLSNIAIPPGMGIVPPQVKSGDYTLRITDHMATIQFNCAACAVVLPQLTPGFKCWIRSDAGTVTVKLAGVKGQLNNLLTITKGSREVFVDYNSGAVSVR